MTRLLVSVRDAQETRVAVAAGAQLIDVKEPARGSLGAASHDMICQVVQTVNSHMPVSVAAGELLDANHTSLARLPMGVSYVKFGLSRCAECRDWRQRFAACAAPLPPRTQLVAVIYADREIAQSPSTDEVLKLAAQHGCAAVLVDTFNKICGSLLDYWNQEECARFVEQAKQMGAISVLAGSLTKEAIEQLLPLDPDYVAVRGAACDQGRNGAISAQRVRALADLLQRRATGRSRFNRRPLAARGAVDTFAHRPETY